MERTGAMTVQLPMAKCKRQLAAIWLVGAGISFFLLFFQTIFGRFGDNASEAWSWLLPTIMPTLSLIVGVLVMDALGKGIGTKTVDRFIFRVALILSTIYLIVVAMTILLQPFASLSPLELMKQSNLWLGPFQGLVSASIGAFFVKKEQR